MAVRKTKKQDDMLKNAKNVATKEADSDVQVHEGDGGNEEATEQEACSECQREIDKTDGENTDTRDPKELGRKGEAAAAAFLERRGFEILEKNWTCKFGEADIIALDDEALHFVEVKTRTNVDKGLPSEAVTPTKRQRYERIATMYLSTYEGRDTAVMFDVISILVAGSNRALLRFHRNAFSAGF